MNTTLLALVLFAGLSLAACSDAELTREARPTTLAGSAWRVVAINGRPPVLGSEPTAVFAAAEVKGSSGCNSYSGGYRYDAATGAIEFGDMISTTAACAEPGRMEVERAFSTAMSQATSVSIDPQGRLLLSGTGWEMVLAVDAVGS